MSETKMAKTMNKQEIIEKLRENGCRITRQRELILDVILEEEGFSSKEIYYKASALDKTIGVATVYRLMSLLEKIGYLSKGYVWRS